MAEHLRAQIVPRRNGIILLGSNEQVVVPATIAVRDQRRIHRQSMADIVGLRAFTAAKLVTESMTSQFLVAVCQQLYWNGHEIWSVIDPLVGSRAIYSFPESVYRFERGVNLDGSWALQSSISVTPLDLIPELGRQRYLHTLRFSPLSRMAWTIFHNELQVTATGERRANVPAPRHDVAVNMDDI